EAYTPDQLRYGTGGGNSADAMQSKDSLIAELNGLKFIRLMELERNIVEGLYHTGVSAIVQLIASKE
ncbi:MAG TPA: SAM-dependent methyltransferase, partial [Blastocatellia bacterium]|nr:SAM-dependent methyltransferase [Blastocatellia bacterium]